MKRFTLGVAALGAAAMLTGIAAPTISYAAETPPGVSVFVYVDGGGRPHAINPAAGPCYLASGSGAAINATDYDAYTYRASDCHGRADVIPHRSAVGSVHFSSVKFVGH
ncbi:hypothetical protein [Kitasatospora sp. HPMI-4]|uniref:hypothetical protein n=1 Tax=Kitasatospora sp. HPMI-4 TaxID=3448443 RepID=UPI003F1DB237